MPNWCDTEYHCTGEAQELKALHDVLSDLEKSESPRLDNEFGNLWFGCIIDALGGNVEKEDSWGEVTWYKLEDNALRIGQSTAWHEREGFREFLERTFPSMNIYYLDVEPEAGYYFTNDVERKYFPGDYLLEIVKGDVYFPEFEPCDTIEQAAERVSAIVGKQLPADEDAVRTAIDEFMKAQKDTALDLHRYERGEWYPRLI